jgi:hypothetical protein
MLVVIGPHWNARRLADSEDYVRLEIAAALEHRKHLIPVLVGGAIIPTKSAIPQDICAMADQSAQEVLDSRWDHDVKELISTLERLLGWPAPRPDATGKSRRGFSGKAIAGASFLPFNLAIGPSPLDVIMYLVINIAALALGTIAVYDTRHGRLRGRWLATLVTGAGLIQLGVIPIAWLMQR